MADMLPEQLWFWCIKDLIQCHKTNKQSMVRETLQLTGEPSKRKQIWTQMPRQFDVTNSQTKTFNCFLCQVSAESIN